MLDLPYQSYVAWRTCITMFHAVAILSTVVRLWTRYKTRRMWVDDYLVIVPMTADFVYCISPWALPSLTPDPRTTGHYDLRKFWATLLLCYIIIWSSRICFMLSLARIFPSGSSTRSRILSLVFLFALLFSCAVLLLAFHCDPYNSADRQCVKLRGYDPATKYMYSTDSFSDIIMIITPLSVLWKVKLPKVEKRVILAALSGSIITLLLFGILMFFTFGPFKYDLPYTIVTSMLSNIVAAASLLSCNALVVVTNIYRLYRRRVTRMEEARGPETTLDDSSSATESATNSAPSFDLEEIKGDVNHRPPGSYATSDRATERVGSRDPFSMYILTELTMDEYDSRYGPADSTHPRSRLSEHPVGSTRTTADQVSIDRHYR